MTSDTEATLGSWLADAAKLFRWRHAHFRPLKTAKGWRTPQSGDTGFPDYVLVRPPRLIFAELKVKPETQAAGRPREDQVAWLDALRQMPGVEVYVWRPEDREQILDILR